MDEKRRQLLKKRLQNFAKNISEKEARDYLTNELGIYNKDGTLTKQYGGKKTDKNHPYYQKKVDII